jgi:TadE-like protein
MIASRNAGRRSRRRGLAAVELAMLLPLLVFVCMLVVDFARVMNAMMILQNCARNGALYEFYSTAGCALPSGWTSLSAAVQADAGNLDVTIPSTSNSNSNPYSPQATSNNYVTVTVQCNFTLLTLGSNGGFPSIGNAMTLTRSVSMPMPPQAATVP